ncbi:MAG: hypothetical protein MZV64_15630 [Ignavibacteriales bacterium]|nr:hypothetical protein [Ignavibacteriales bacterium]
MIEKGSGFLLRFQRFVESGDALRFQLYEEAIKEFLNHPIIGNQFVLENGIGAGIYPHNIFLESLMALGFIGGILILILLFNSLKICYYSIKELDNYSWIRLLFIQYFIFSMMSGGIYNSPLLWIFMALNFAVDKFNKTDNLEKITIQPVKNEKANEVFHLIS